MTNYRAYLEAPDPTIGYYRGAPPRYGGTGSMQGPKGAGLTIGQRSSGGEWHPTVKYLILLVIAEMVIFGCVRYYSRHGG